MSEKNTYITVSETAKIPQIGFGTWLIGPENANDSVYHAIKSGYRHIDCAQIYGNETEVGGAIKKAIDDKLINSRDDLWITSKIWNDEHLPEDIVKATDGILSRLGIEYLDLLLIHWDISFVKGGNHTIHTDFDRITVYKEMEKLVDAGKTKFLGISNFSAEMTRKIHEAARHKPITNQVESHPYWNQIELESTLKELGMFMTSYSPLNMNKPDPSLNLEYHSLLESPKLIEIAKKHDVSPAVIALRWHIERGRVVIPRSITPSRIEENFTALDVKLDEGDMATLNSFTPQVRGLNPVGWHGAGIPYFK